MPSETGLQTLSPIPIEEEEAAARPWEADTLPPDAEPAPPQPTPRWMRKKRSCLARYRCLVIFSLTLSVALAAVWILPSALDPVKKTPKQIITERKWIDSSPYMLDRWSCRFFGLCGLHHLRSDPPGHSINETDEEKRRAGHPGYADYDDLPDELRRRASTPAEKPKNGQKDIPSFVLDHAPLIHLHWAEHFWPSDIKEFINHVDPSLHFKRVAQNISLTLDNLGDLNSYSSKVVLSSQQDVESRPEWLFSHDSRPNLNDTADSETETFSAKPFKPSTRPWYHVAELNDKKARAVHVGHKPDKSGYSSAPAILIMVDKGNGILDAFWFFFYAYNLGQTVLGARYGNHVGDWEHCMIRFENGIPKGVFLSEHEGGLAYTFEALNKRTSSNGAQRPIIYSAVGSHAMYATSGNHPYVLPFQMLKDETNDGPVWDPTLNNYAFHYTPTPEQKAQDLTTQGFRRTALDDGSDTDTASLIPASSNPNMPTSWFHYSGAWGDDLFPLADHRQWRFFGQYHYVRGPFGPKWKQLSREQLCTKKVCKILEHIDDKGSWHQ